MEVGSLKIFWSEVMDSYLIKSNFLETSINGAQTNFITVIIKSTRNFFYGVRGTLSDETG